ncbi:class I SAM-dependent methyltransferase [Pseudoalteromonas phenolica]|uniref:class I SAM-dependent methyltransferase n=1 Tax=Pseudoalteromonas phenolica TaxID=161398 RepID=UPI00110BE95B|nr:class I SAM-dependent methyltransferase [Pseudoalteromonas phenolica]TMO54056.1 hypothetical protein CWC21_16890 [Pseudoalteromonas phenolica]
MNNHWSEYWRQGYITSFGDAFKSNYQGEIKSLWESFSLSLNKNSKVLDVGTGNGALVKLIQNVSEHECIGIDLARINTKVTQCINGHFISNVSAENMPFNNNEFDAVISQFALEYSQVELSIKEVYRVLKPGGKLYLVCHCPDSKIVLPNKLILKVCHKVKNNILSDLKKLVTKLSNNEEIDICKVKIEDFISSFKSDSRTALEDTNFPSFYNFLLSNKNIDFNRAYNLFESELELLMLRLNELVNASENTVNLRVRLKDSSSLFSQVNSRELKDRSNNLMAIVVTAKK